MENTGFNKLIVNFRRKQIEEDLFSGKEVFCEFHVINDIFTEKNKDLYKGWAFRMNI